MSTTIIKFTSISANKQRESIGLPMETIQLLFTKGISSFMDELVKITSDHHKDNTIKIELTIKKHK